MLKILYQDKHLVAINKPTALLVHRSLIDKRAQAFALQLTRNQIGQRVYPVHRLDKPTSGVLLFALSSEMAKCLSLQFAQRGVQKTYHALVRGYTNPEGLIDYPLVEQLDKIADANADNNKPAQSAVTSYRCLENVELPFAVGRYTTARYSWIELTPHTGRKHQLRRHMKHIFHPIVGDTTHGDGRHNTLVREQFDCHRLMLHASGIEFTHPETLAPMHITANRPGDMNKILRSMGLQL